ncbi:hypothetical protein IAD21_05201 [Abditibacteriota bacterium]|nr:hypothetical protein IAD21_05201 [Abditibacteriota bacterium]
MNYTHLAHRLNILDEIVKRLILRALNGAVL